ARHDAKAKAGRAGGIASGVARRKQERSSEEADVKQNGSTDPSKTKPRPDPFLTSRSLTTSTVVGDPDGAEEIEVPDRPRTEDEWAKLPVIDIDSWAERR